MKMAIQEGMIRLVEVDAVRASRIKSWGKMRYVRSRAWWEGECSLDLLNRLAKLGIRTAQSEELRILWNRQQIAVDKVRYLKDPKPLRDFPVTKKLYEHQVRAADMAMITFGWAAPEEVGIGKEDAAERGGNQGKDPADPAVRKAERG